MERPLQQPGPGLLNPSGAFKHDGSLTPCWPFRPHLSCPAACLTKSITWKRSKKDVRCGRRETHLNLVFSFQTNPSLKRSAAGRPLPEGVCIGSSGCCYESCCYGTAPILSLQTKIPIPGKGISPFTSRCSMEG